MSSILETFEALHPGSRKLAERAQDVFPSGVTHDIRAFSPWPVYVERAAGSRKWDVDGNEYVDYIGGHGSLLLGHNRPEVVEATQRALARGTHFGSSHEGEVEWGEQVLRMVPCGERVRFMSSGTEATMMALRLARAYTGRERVVKLVEHFHGWHDLVVGRLRDDEDTHPHSVGVPAGFYDSLAVLPSGDAEALRETLARRDVAAVIVEPTGAHWGTHPLPSSYLHAASEAAAETGTLFIMDEVITGFRMAPGGAQQRYGVRADLSTHAKILAGGLPGGCVTGREDVISMLELREDAEWNAQRRVSHQGTYNANPVAAAAGVTALRLIERGGETERADAVAARLVRGLNKLFAERSVPGSAWAVSSMWHLNLGYAAPRPADLEWDAVEEPLGVTDELVLPLKWALFNHGVDLMATGGMTSSAHTDADIDATIEAFGAAIGELRAEHLLD